MLSKTYEKESVNDFKGRLSNLWLGTCWHAWGRNKSIRPRSERNTGGGRGETAGEQGEQLWPRAAALEGLGFCFHVPMKHFKDFISKYHHYMKKRTQNNLFLDTLWCISKGNFDSAQFLPSLPPLRKCYQLLRPEAWGQSGVCLIITWPPNPIGLRLLSWTSNDIQNPLLFPQLLCQHPCPPLITLLAVLQSPI